MDLLQRLDDRVGELAAPLSARVFEGRVARAHGPQNPLRYDTGDEYRDMSEVQRIVAALPGTPVTFPHPAGLIRHGATARIIGTVTSARVDGEHAIATVVITDAAALAEIESGGPSELSLGYECKLDDARFQRDVSLDHLAVVARARCGATCALRTDAADGCKCGGACGGAAQDLRLATSVPISGLDVLPPKEPAVNLEQALAALAVANQELGAEKARADAATEQRDLEKTRADAADQARKDAETARATAEAAADQARKDAETARAAQAQAKVDAEAALATARTDAESTIAERVAERVAVETVANAILGAVDAEGKPVDRSKMDADAIKRAVVKHVDAIEIPDGKHPAYVQAMYEGAQARARAGAQSSAATRQVIEQNRQDGLPAPATDPEKAASAALRDQYSSAWMTPAKKKGE